LTKQFWYAFLSWWNAGENEYNNVLLEKDIILGYNLGDRKDNTLNCCILIGKKMIYEQKIFHNKQPDIYKFHCDLKSVIEMERQISIKNGKLSEFQIAWGNLEL
jgi:hypothetical protein